MPEPIKLNISNIKCAMLIFMRIFNDLNGLILDLLNIKALVPETVDMSVERLKQLVKSLFLLILTSLLISEYGTFPTLTNTPYGLLLWIVFRYSSSSFWVTVLVFVNQARVGSILPTPATLEWKAASFTISPLEFLIASPDFMNLSTLTSLCYRN